MADITLTNNFFSILTIIAQASILLLAGAILLYKRKKEAGSVLRFFAQNAVLFAFIVATISTLGSLFYSEVVGFDVCKLCWFQRILMYPQSIILGLALIKKDRKILDYSIALSIFGILIALYHYLLQLGIAPSVACPIVGYSSNCASRFVMNFGYITIPMMSLTAFTLITLIGFSKRYLRPDSTASQ